MVSSVLTAKGRVPHLFHPLKEKWHFLQVRSLKCSKDQNFDFKFIQWVGLTAAHKTVISGDRIYTLKFFYCPAS